MLRDNITFGATPPQPGRAGLLCLGLAVAVCVFMAACAAAMWWQPLTTDENDFFLAIAHWTEWRYLIPHPHLYVHWAQALVGLFGANVGAVRLSVLIPNLLTIALLVWLGRLLYGSAAGKCNWPAISGLAVLLYGLNPLVVQNAVLIDIDNGLLTTALTGLLCLWLALQAQATGVRIIALSVGFAVCLWIKLPTPPILAAAMAAYCVLRREWREAMLVVAFAGTGSALFAALHSIYGVLTGYTLADAFAAFAWRAGNETSILAQVPGNFVQTTGVMVFWLGLPFAALAVPAMWNRAHQLIHGSPDVSDLGLIYVAGVFAFYGTMIVPAWGYPRYHTPALPILALVVSAWIVNQIKQPGRLFWLTMLAIIAGALAYIALVVGDPMYDIYRATFETTDIAERLRIGGAAAGRLALPTVVIAAGSLALARPAGLTHSAMLSAALAALAVGSAIATNWIQSTAEYSTRYRYTYLYADRQAATEAVRASVPPEGYSLTDKDLLWYAGRPGEQIYPYLSNPAGLKDMLRSRRVDVIAWTQKEKLKAGALNADAEALTLLARCYRSQEFGIFTVLTRASDAPCLGIR